MIKYKIIELNIQEHSIVVRYYTDKITEQSLAVDVLDGVIRRCRTDYNINLPIPAPIGKDLHNFIITRAPSEWLRAQEDIINPDIDTSMEHIKELINQEISATIDNTLNNSVNTIIYNPELVNIVHKILVDFNVIEAPPQ